MTKIIIITLCIACFHSAPTNAAFSTAAVITGGLSSDLKIIANVSQYCASSEDKDKCGTIAIPALLGPRYGHIAVNMGDSLVVAGGMDDQGNILATVETFNVKGITPPLIWTSAPAMAQVRLTPYGAVVTNSSSGSSTLYMCGGTGDDFLSTCESYSTGDTSWHRMPPMLSAKTGGAAASIGDDFYVIGGFNGNVLNNVDKYSTSASKWSSVAPMNTARFRHAAMAVDGMIFACGGANASGYVFADCEQYDPTQNKWVKIAPMLTPRYFTQLGSLTDGTISAVGGCSSHDTKVGSVETYDPKTGKWVAGKSLDSPRCFYGLTGY